MRPTLLGLAKGIVPSLLALQGAIAWPASAASPSEPGEFVAYIDRVLPERTQLADAVRVRRHGEWRSVASDHGLIAGDELFINQPGTVVVVRILATNQRLPVRKSTQAASPHPLADWTVPPEPGLPDALADWFWRFLEGAEHKEGQTRIAATRALGAETCNYEAKEPIQFQLPLPAPPESILAGGSQTIFVSWSGGAQPVSVALAKAETGETVVETPGVHGICATYLPRTSLQPGHYQLTVTDANQVRKRENLLVVANPPDLPAELRTAKLPEETRQLYAATWLSVVDGGKWAFEAQQRVAAMDCRSAAVQEWLHHWRGFTQQALACGNVRRD